MNQPRRAAYVTSPFASVHGTREVVPVDDCCVVIQPFKLESSQPQLIVVYK